MYEDPSFIFPNNSRAKLEQSILSFQGFQKRELLREILPIIGKFKANFFLRPPWIESLCCPRFRLLVSRRFRIPANISLRIQMFTRLHVYWFVEFSRNIQI